VRALDAQSVNEGDDWETRSSSDLSQSRDITIDKKRLSPTLSKKDIEYSVINMFNTLTFLLSKPQFILDRVRDVTVPSSVGHFRNLSVILSLAARDNQM